MATEPDDIEALTSLWEPEIRRAFLSAVKDHRDRIDMAELVRRLEAGDIDGALSLASPEPASFLSLDRAIEAAFLAGGIASVAGMGKRRAFAFDFRSLGSQSWLEQHVQTLIRRVVDDQRAMLRAQVGQSGSPRQAARDLAGTTHAGTKRREGGLIGLSSQAAEWARNYERELSGVPSAEALTRKLREPRFDRAVKQAIAEGRPLEPEIRDAAVKAYRNRALRARADSIGLSEASQALHQAQVEAWGQAVAKGIVQASWVRRFWLVTDDEHLRLTHRAVPGLNPNGVGLYEPFQTPKGLAMQPGWSFDPGCRCHAKVRVVAPKVAVFA
jgi:hypothetical protein